jgi:predicted amidohydrolase YtcJ
MRAKMIFLRRNYWHVVAPLCWLAALGAGPGDSKPEAADIVFKHGKIYTVDDKKPLAESLAVKGGLIVFVGDDADAARYKGSATRVVDLGGKTVVPGLTDSHCHLSGVGARELNLNLEGTTSLADFLAKVQERIKRAEPGQWVMGAGWIESAWKPQTFPTRWDLDKISPNNPVFLARADRHASVANSAAIRLTGVDRNTPSPFGGEIMKDERTGEPNGMFLDNAQALVTKHIPAGKPDDDERALLLGAERSLKLGWTEVHIAGNTFAEVALLKKLYGERRIKLRIYDAILGPSADTRRLLSDGPTIDACDRHFTCRSIKVVFDGALGSKGAALLANYSDYNSAGFLKWKEEDLLPTFQQALRRGMQVWVHAIGDRANHEILAIFAKAFASVPAEERTVKEPRWRVEHAQIVLPSDIPRFAQLGIIPSMQPSHAIGDLHFAASRLGLERLAGAYAWHSFLDAGSIIAGGTDAPVERGEPMIEFYAAVARKDLHGYSGDGWHPEQAVSRNEALKMFTIWAAYAAFEENSRGSLEPGKLADFTVLSQDIMTIPAGEIPKTECLMTVIGGEIVYEARPGSPN